MVPGTFVNFFESCYMTGSLLHDGLHEFVAIREKSNEHEVSVEASVQSGFTPECSKKTWRFFGL